MAKHYLVLVFPSGKEDVRREYFELSEPNESKESALERWIQSHPSMSNRQRNRERTESALRASPLYVQLAHPSSWHRAREEEFPAPTKKGVRRGR